MAKIEYVGLKESRTDTVAGTGIVWIGKGDVREVPDVAAPRLLRHPDIWKLHVPETASASPAPAPAPAPVAAPAPTPVTSAAPTTSPPATNVSSEQQSDASSSTAEQSGGNDESGKEGGDADAPSFVMQTASGPLVLDALDRDTLVALAKEGEVEHHVNLGEKKLRALLATKFPVKAN